MAPTKTPEQRLSVDAARAELAEAQAVLDGLRRRVADGDLVDPLDVARADGAVKVAEVRVEAAEEHAVKMADAERAAELDRVRRQFVKIADRRSEVAAALDEATARLVEALRTAREIDGQLAELASAINGGRGPRLTGSLVEVDGYRWSSEHSNLIPRLAAEVALKALNEVFDGRDSYSSNRAKTALIPVAYQNRWWPSEAYRTPDAGSA